MADENKVKRNFVKDFKGELKKVIWPTPKEVIKGTFSVIVIVFIVTVIVIGLDYVLIKANDLAVDKVTGGKITQYKNDVVEKQKVLTEIQKLVTPEQFAMYNAYASQMDLETLKEMLNQLKNPSTTTETSAE